MKRSMLSALSFCFFMCGTVLPALAQAGPALDKDPLLKLQKEGWKVVQDGVLRRELRPNEVETFVFGEAGFSWKLRDLRAQLRVLRREFQVYPTPELRKAIASHRKLIASTLKMIERARAAEESVETKALKAGCIPTFAYGANASYKTDRQGTWADAVADFNVSAGCDSSGEVYAYAFAKTTVSGAPSTATVTDGPRSGSNVSASADANRNGGAPCESYAFASVTSDSLVPTSYSVSQTNDRCPKPSSCTTSLTAPGTSPAKVIVTCVDDPPTAVSDSATVNEDSGPTAINVLANDTDPDGGPISIQSVTQPANGTAVILGGGAMLTYRPNADYCNTPPGTPDTFTYTLAPGGSSTLVTVTVTCVNDPPLADNDAFDFIGNTDLVVDLSAPATPYALASTPTTLGVLDGDGDPIEGDPIAVSAITVGACTDSSAPFDCSDPAVGRVQMQPNGRFIFSPAPGDAGATETFTYTVTDYGVPAPASTTATVTLTRFERVWYVKNNAPAGGDGTSSSPFNSITAANLSDNDSDGDLADDLDSAGDYIFVYFGDGTSTNQAGGLVLENGQHLIGEYAGLSLNLNLNGNGAPTHLVAAGSRPLLDDTVVDAFEGVSARNVIPAEIVGMSLAGNVNGIDWTTTAAFAGSGTFVIRDNVVRSAANEGVDLNLAGTGATRLAFRANILTATGTALDIQETGTGSLTIIAFEENVVSGNTGGSGVVVSNAIFDSFPGGALNTVNGGTMVIGASGNGVAAHGMLLTNVTGDLAFSDLDIFNDAGAGLAVTGMGALNAGAGTGFRIVVPPGVSTIASNGGPAVSVNNASISLPVSFLRSTNSTTTGLSLVNAFGGVGSTTLSVSFGQISDPVGASGTAVNISGGNGNISLGLPILSTSGNAVVIANRTSDTVFFTGAITETGSGISLTSNTGATVRFSGGIAASTGTSSAFSATGGGTVEVCDENPCNPGATGSLVNTLATTTGTALNVANTTIGSNNLEFRRISSNGAASGIVLNTTGASGGLKVTGTGSAGTGGTINASTGPGIFLTSTSSANLAYMNVQNGGDDGIRGSGVNGLNLNNINVTSNGNATGERGIDITELTGSGSMASCTVSGSAEHNVSIANTSGTLSAFNVTASSFTDTNMTSGGDGFLFENNGPGAMTISITSSTFTDNKGNHFRASTSTGATGSMNVTFSSNTLTTTPANNPNVVGGGILLNPHGSTGLTFTISDNNIQQAFSEAINLSLGTSSTAAAAMAGTISGNTIGTAGDPDSGSETASGISVTSNGAVLTTVAITDNAVRQYANPYGIVVSIRDGSTSMNAAITGNTVANPGAFAINGIRIDAGATAGDSGTLCAAIRGNSATGSGPGADTDIRLRQRANTTLRLPGYGGSNDDTMAVNSFVAGNNAGSDVSSAHNVGGGGGGFAGGAACPTP